MNRPPDEPPSIGRSNPDPSQGSSSRRPSRRTVIGALVATTAVAALIGGLALSSTGTPSANAGSSTLGGGPAVPTASTTSSASQSGKFGSVTTSPGLSAEFKKTFTDQYIEANGLRQHAVIGGEGPPLLLVHGWPENWYAWRLLMPALARNHTVIAVDQRGIGLTEKPPSGYDTGTLAKDLAALMDKLGHERFSLVGHDTGMIISYALAADYPDRVERVALAEVPGPPGVVPSPPLFVPEPLNNRLWHIPFNRADAKLVEELVSGREDAFYGYEFKIQGGGVAKEAIDYYVRLLSNHESLSGSFGFYRAWDATIAQNEKRAKTKLKMPVLGIGGQDSWGKAVADSMKGAAVNVQTAVIPATGHWLAEQSPDRMVAVLAEFLSSGRVNAEQGAATSPPLPGSDADPAAGDQRPGARCVISCSTQPLPSGSLKVASEPYEAPSGCGPALRSCPSTPCTTPPPSWLWKTSPPASWKISLTSIPRPTSFHPARPRYQRRPGTGSDSSQAQLR